MKKVILGVLALILAIGLVIGGYVLFAFRNLQEYAVTDATCPYSWQELRSGTYHLEIDTSAYPDHSWTVECYPQNVIAVTEASSKSGTVAFSILPLNMGQTYLQVYCEQTEPFAVRAFEISMQISVSEEFEITVEKTEHKDYDGIATLGDGEDYPVQWWADPNGAVNLLVTEGGSGNWEALDYDGDSLEVTGPFYRDGSCGFEIQGKLVGAFPLTLYDGISKAVRLQIEVDKNLTAAVTDFNVGDYFVDRGEEHAALEAAAGMSIVLPEQAVATDYYVRSETGAVSFRLNDREWRLEILPCETIEEMVSEAPASAAETETDDSGSTVPLNAYRFSNGVVAVWNNGVRGMALYGDQELSLTDLLSVARQLAEASHG